MAKASASTFRARIRGWKDATKAQLEGLARQSCFEMAERVVQATPVDTGFLRGSWQPSVNEPGEKKGSPDPTGVVAIAQAMSAANAVMPGDHFYMLNNASYARFVEYGTSKMAGRHYVGDTVKKWPEVVKQVAKELKK
jgi:HK97 gp10 family phage protein